jgi:hypothetical protein
MWRHIWSAFVPMAIVIFTATNAGAVTFESIAGKWCTAGGTEQFDRNNLIAILSSTGERRVYPIQKYDFTHAMVTVTWKDAKNEISETDFGEFSADGRQMVQLENKKGPRREFHRC